MVMKLWCIVAKDLVSECRARRVWPAMLLLGIVVAWTFAGQMDLPETERLHVAGGLLWLAIFFAGMLAMDRSFAAEREDGCWEGLLAFPVSTAAVYLAKLAVNAIALAALECVLIPLFAVLSGVALFAHPAAILLVAGLGTLGLSAAGTLLGAVSAQAKQSAYLLPTLVLPMAIPVVLGAAEATRLAAEGDFGVAWWRWIQLLAAFAALFITLGIVLFDFVVQD